MPIVTIKSKNETVNAEVRSGLGFQALCLKHQTPIEFDCRKADCGICVFRVIEGEEHLSPKTHPEADFLKAMKALPSERLACQTRVLGDVTVQIDFLI